MRRVISFLPHLRILFHPSISPSSSSSQRALTNRCISRRSPFPRPEGVVTSFPILARVLANVPPLQDRLPRDFGGHMQNTSSQSICYQSPTHRFWNDHTRVSRPLSWNFKALFRVTNHTPQRAAYTTSKNTFHPGNEEVTRLDLFFFYGWKYCPTCTLPPGLSTSIYRPLGAQQTPGHPHHSSCFSSALLVSINIAEVKQTGPGIGVSKPVQHLEMGQFTKAQSQHFKPKIEIIFNR